MDRFSKDHFSGINEELSWCFFRWNGNPYIAEEMINERYTSKDETYDLGK